MTAIPYRESGVLRACRDLLDVEKLFYLRLNSGKVQTIRKTWVQLCPEGTPDMLLLCSMPVREYARAEKAVVWIETKGSSINHRKAQMLFQMGALDRGEVYLLVNDVDLLRDWLIQRGVIKGNRGIAS